MSGQNSINSDNFMLGVNPNKNIKPSNSLLNHLKELEKSNIAKINGNSNNITVNNFCYPFINNTSKAICIVIVNVSCW